MALTYVNFKTLYPNSTIAEAIFNSWISNYKSQLSTYFRFNDTEKAVFINIDYCGQEKVFLKRPLVLDDAFPIKVEQLNKKERILTTIINEKDFLYVPDEVDNQEYVYALDFGCLGCVCKCDQLKITGVWGLKFPEYLENQIYALIESQGGVEIKNDCPEIQSEKIGEYSVTYREAKTNQTTLDINNVFSIPGISSIFLKIQNKFLYV